MAISKERKAELIAVYKDFLNRADGIVVTEYRGITVTQISDLRARLREVQGRYVITKNTLFKIALRDMNWPVPDDLLVGTTGVVFGQGNFPTVAKSVLGYNKDFPDILAIKGGVMSGQILSAAQVDAVSSLPSLDELRSQLAGLIVQPAAGLVSMINAGVASVAQVLAAYVQKQEEAA
ncbi:MAG: 50S ribosomal protein L10 [Chloroflexi bacterium]|nr:50S ribosomal protein L10 [Chloroflexota bacterium]